MANLPALTAKQMARILRRDGWELDRVKGSHHAFVHPTKPGTVTVPMHRGTLKTGTMRSIMRQADLSRADIERLR